MVDCHSLFILYSETTFPFRCMCNWWLGWISCVKNQNCYKIIFRLDLWAWEMGPISWKWRCHFPHILQNNFFHLFPIISTRKQTSHYWNWGIKKLKTSSDKSVCNKEDILFSSFLVLELFLWPTSCPTSRLLIHCSGHTCNKVNLNKNTCKYLLVRSRDK